MFHSTRFLFRFFCYEHGGDSSVNYGHSGPDRINSVDVTELANPIDQRTGQSARWLGDVVHHENMPFDLRID